MKLYLDTVGILEIFAEAQGLAVRVLSAPPPGFIVPPKGKSGLSRRRNRTEAEKKAEHAERQSRLAKKYLADPAKAPRIRALRRARVNRWRAKKRAEKLAKAVAP